MAWFSLGKEVYKICFRLLFTEFVCFFKFFNHGEDYLLDKLFLEIKLTMQSFLNTG